MVSCTRAADRHRPDSTAAAQQRLAVLHTQNVVGTFQNGGIFAAQQLLHRRLTAGGIGYAVAQPGAQSVLVVRGEQAGRHMLQRVRVAALAAESHVGDNTGGLQGLNAAVGKALRRADCPGQRQLQYQIHTAFHGGFGPGVLAHQSEVAPLDEVAAHHADDGRLLTQLLPDLPDQI